ncbi:hypothetical protein DH2020_013927 [Rehmannia glutinosa]|uniref:C3H1-type domain-containing protein n=1 Tax=Rehmannia glutinosa TaxID=99300 RepID=A0ABR0WUX4_REHGL
MNVNILNPEEDAFASLLELAANNDLEGFQKQVDREPSSVDEVGLWYGRRKGSSSQMVLQHRTPLMVAATYGSIDVLKNIISLPEVDVNRSCGVDGCTALHCAASSGSVNAVDVVKLLLAAGADPDRTDANGRRPVDAIIVSPVLQGTKNSLQTMLTTDSPFQEEHDLRVSIGSSNTNSPPEKKEYPIDPSLPDIKNSIYSTDEFRMFSFKIRPCSRAYSHDWTECPFVHPGENARRRDPRKYHYSCVPCPDFRKGACRRGDMCEYAHGVFECWLHPAQYRTRLCKDGTSCNRRVCFFAHTQEELRPLYVSTGSAVPSPRSASAANAMDFAAAMGLLPGSPTVPLMSPSPFTPPMSPSNNDSSRLRSSFNARDFPAEDLCLYSDTDLQQQHQFLDELSLMSQPSSLNLSARPKTLTPSNLDDMFCAESSSSPRYTNQALPPAAVFSPNHKSAILNQFHQQQSMLSPVKTKFSPFGLQSPGRMSPSNVDPVSPMSARMTMIAQREKQHQQFRSLSSRELGSSAAAAVASLEETWSKWDPPHGRPEWAPATDEYGKFKRSSSFELHNNGVEEPDLSWVQSLVKESPQDPREKSSSRVGECEDSTEQVDQSVLGAWLEQMQLDQLRLDQLVAQ